MKNHTLPKFFNDMYIGEFLLVLSSSFFSSLRFPSTYASAGTGFAPPTFHITIADRDIVRLPPLAGRRDGSGRSTAACARARADGATTRVSTI